MNNIQVLFSYENGLKDVNDDLEAIIDDAIMVGADYMNIACKNSEVSVFITDSEHIKSLNEKYRGIDKPTNVLSFPCDIDHGVLGDIVLAIDVVKNESIEQNKTFNNHLRHLVVHSLLHLIGYDHINNSDADIMEGLEIKILEKMGISNPYL